MKTLKWMAIIVGAVVGGSWVLSKLSTPKQEVLYSGDIVQDVPEAETIPDKTAEIIKAIEAELKKGPNI